MTCSTDRGIYRFGPRSLTPRRHLGTKSNQAGHAPRESAISEAVRRPRARPHRGATSGEAQMNQPDKVSGRGGWCCRFGSVHFRDRLDRGPQRHARALVGPRFVRESSSTDYGAVRGHPRSGTVRSTPTNEVKNNDNHRNHDEDMDEGAPDVDHEEGPAKWRRPRAASETLCPADRRSPRTLLTVPLPGNAGPYPGRSAYRES
jgi:hypothetical protein